MTRAKAGPKFTRLTSEARRASLVEAGLACMARGGIQEFTVDKICAEAGVSRGLITHHFGSMNGLLAAVYAALYEVDTGFFNRSETGGPWIVALLDRLFAPMVFNRASLNVWLTLWGQISINAELAAEHRRQYASYVARVADAIGELAAERGCELDPTEVARTLIALVDGLSVQHCVDPSSMPPEEARAACLRFLKPYLGDLE